MMRARVMSLLLFATAVLAGPAQAEFWAISDLDLVVDKNTDVSPPQYWLKGFTFPDYEIPGEMLVTGNSNGTVNVDDEAGRRDITLADNLELNDFAPRNGAVPPEITTINFGGSPTWQDTNGDKFDFFIFEAGGNDEFALQAILPGGVLGQKIVIPASKWKDLGPEPAPGLVRTPGPNNNQPIHGIAWKVTDLVDDAGKPLTNESVIEGLVFTSPGMDPSCICAVKGAPFASGPKPADGATIAGACTLLQWTAGMDAVSEEVYLSANRDDVENIAAPAKLATVTLPAANVCAPGTPYADGLAPGVYYWRIVTIDTAGARKAGPIWSFTVLSGSAFNPIPADGALYVDPNANLSWSPGADAIVHYVFIGTDRDQVGGATQGTPTADPAFEPGTLEKGKTYYWRVDEFDGRNTTTGRIWSFSTVPVGEGGLKAEYFASEEPLLGDPVVTRIDPQIDFNWNQNPPDQALDRLLFSARWKGEITIPVTGTYTFILRSNDGSRLYINDQLVVQDWSTHVVRDTAGAVYLEARTYPIAVEYFQQGGSAEMHLLWRSNLIPQQIIPSVALVPEVRARLVYPADKAIDVSQNPRLRWEGSALDIKYDVYLGEDEAAVEQADTGTAGIYLGQQEEAFYLVELEPGTTYYWRIDEVIEGDPQSPVKGRVWSFTTAEFIVVDDFENYLDEKPERIFDVWADGWGDPANGSIVGHEVAPFAEQTIIHSGVQSMIFAYDNNSVALASEAERIFDTTQDWTMAGDLELETLALWFRGIAPVGSFSYDAAKSQYTIVGSGDGIAGTSDGFRFVHKKMTGNGTITARLESMGHSNDWALAGVMFRETLEPGSPMAISGVRATGQAVLRWRELADADLRGTVEVPPFPATIVIPHYVRLTRQGTTFRAEHSSDGTTWEPVGESISVPMGQQVYVGLAVSANVPDTQGVANTAVFSNVTTSGTVDAPGALQTVKDIGIGGNSPQPFYVVITDKTGKSAVVAHPDGPDAIVTNAWTEWSISLADVTGVNLAAVARMTIGVGNRAGAPVTGSGTLYIDDIRLIGVSALPEILAIKPADTVEATGDNGTLLSINGIDVGSLVLGTTTTNFEKYADHPAAHADDFDLGTYASLDDSAYITMSFAAPVTTVFIIERGGNDEGFIEPLDAAGEPMGAAQPYAKSDWKKPGFKVNGQDAGAIVITSQVPISGISVLPPAGGVMGLDPAVVAGVPAP